MELKSFGCSFILGTDLSDLELPDSHSYLTWPSLLSTEFDLTYQCYAGGGHGNLSILDRLSHHIYCDPRSLFVIQWTYMDRFDYSDPDGHHFNKGFNDWLTVLPGTRSSQADFYFRELHSEYKDKLQCLIYIKTALDLLREHNCKFLMTCLDNLIFCDQFHTSQSIGTWQKKLASDMFFWENYDFLNWSRHKGFPVGPTGHPLEEAHAAAAEFMRPTIDAILHTA